MNDAEHKTTVRMPLSLHKAARIRAIEEGTTLSDVIRELLRRWVDGEIELSTHEENEPEES